MEESFFVSFQQRNFKRGMFNCNYSIKAIY